ncbi:MAG: hypothetical protein QXE81_05005, partial [Desulfurococcaceae archaeon]
VIVGLLTSLAPIIGIMPANLPRDQVTPFLLRLMNPVLGSLIAISIIGAAVSTSNSIVLAVSGSVLSLMEKRRQLFIARLIDGFLVLLAAILAMMRVGFIVELSVLTSVLLLPLAPITILGVVWNGYKTTILKYSAILALLVGTGIASYYAIILGPRKAFVELIIGLPLSVWVLTTTMLILFLGVIIAKIKSTLMKYSKKSFLYPSLGVFIFIHDILLFSRLPFHILQYFSCFFSCKPSHKFIG